MVSRRISVSLFASRFFGVFRLASLLGLLLAPIAFAPMTQAQSVLGTRAQLSQESESVCPQPPANTDLTKLSDSQLALLGLPPHPRTSTRLAWWQNVLGHARHRDCTASGGTRHQTRPTIQSLTSQFNGYVNSNIWAGVVDTGSGYQAVAGSWQQPHIQPYTADHASDAYLWVGVGGAYGIVPNSGILVQAGTESYYWFDSDTQAWTTSYDDFVEVFDDSTGNDWQIRTSIANQNPYGDTMSVYVSSNYDFPGYNYFLIQDTRTSTFYSCSYYSCPCTLACPSLSPAYAPLSNGSSTEWILERGANDALARFTTNCTASPTCITLGSDYVERNNQQINIGVDPETAVSMYDYNVNPVVELAFPGPVHNNNFFNDYWLRYV